jgi:hypothetical protein
MKHGLNTDEEVRFKNRVAVWTCISFMRFTALTVCRAWRFPETNVAFLVCSFCFLRGRLLSERTL